MNRRDARLTDVLEPVRDLTVSELLEAMARTLDAGHDVHAEPKARNPAGQPLREGRLALPCRHDLLVRHKGGTLPREVQGGNILRFEPITIVEPEGFVCVIGPFRWDAVHVLVEESARPAAVDDPNGAAGFDTAPKEASEPVPDMPGKVADTGAAHSHGLPEDAKHAAGGKAMLPNMHKVYVNRPQLHHVEGEEPDWRPLRRWFLEWFQSRFADEAPDLDGAVHSVQGPDRVPGGWRLRIDLGSAPVDAVSGLIGALEASGAQRVRIGEPG
ncbi:MAG: hypothetical protein AAFV96_02670 [Pseudomonadota bacterium]